MLSPTRHSRRRFFGFGGVVRRLRRREIAEGIARPRRQRCTEADRVLQSERTRFAAQLDVELRLACRSEAGMRRELGDAARAFMRTRAYDRLGFVRLSDYARERLGVSARTLHDAAWLATRLEALPAISTAYDRSELSWAAARVICRVAVAADEEKWLAIARRSTVDTLERLVARTRRPDEVPPDPEGVPNEIDGEPAVRWRFVCPSRVRALWRRALELASRAAGEPLSVWRAADVVAAEGSSGRPRGTSMGDRALREAVRLARADRRAAERRRGRTRGKLRAAGRRAAEGGRDRRTGTRRRDPRRPLQRIALRQHVLRCDACRRGLVRRAAIRRDVGALRPHLPGCAPRRSGARAPHDRAADRPLAPRRRRSAHP